MPTSRFWIIPAHRSVGCLLHDVGGGRIGFECYVHVFLVTLGLQLTSIVCS